MSMFTGLTYLLFVFIYLDRGNSRLSRQVFNLLMETSVDIYFVL